MAYKRINYEIDFKGRTETMENVFGDKPISPTEMVRALWKFIKINKLGKKTD